jgi:hypothetical protein
MDKSFWRRLFKGDRFGGRQATVSAAAIQPLCAETSEGSSAEQPSRTGNPAGFLDAEYQCPRCGQIGGKSILGTATMFRRSQERGKQLMMLYRAGCRCGRSSTFWNDCTKYYGNMQKRAEAMYNRQNIEEEWLFVSGSNDVPDEAKAVMNRQGNVAAVGKIFVAR